MLKHLQNNTVTYLYNPLPPLVYSRLFGRMNGALSFEASLVYEQAQTLHPTQCHAKRRDEITVLMLIQIATHCPLFRHVKEIDVPMDVHSTRLAEVCVRSAVMTPDHGSCLADIAMNLRGHG